MTGKNKRNFVKGVAAALMAAIVVSAANPVPVMAAGKLTTNVAAKKNVKATKNKIVIHTKSGVQLKVKYAGKDVTKKASYKVSNRKVAQVKNGKITAKKNGKTVVTVKYNGMTKKYNITVAANHNWKEHKVTKTVKRYANICSCGVNLSALAKKQPYAGCTHMCYNNEWCECAETEHELNHINNNETYTYSYKPVYTKVTYTDYYTCECGAKKAGEAEPK